MKTIKKYTLRCFKFFCGVLIALLTSVCSEETKFKVVRRHTPELPGYEREYVTDIFFQTSETNNVDFIWIIDNSGSMRNEQNILAENFDLFIDAFLEKSIDFKMGFTTTDTAGRGSKNPHNGEFTGSVPVLTSDMDPEFLSNHFKENVRVGTDGSGRERGLEAALKAVKKTNRTESINYRFIRPDALLAIIIISDENDISPDSTYSYIKSIRSIKGKNSDVTIFSIVDTTAESFEDPIREPIDLDLYYSHRWKNPGGLRYINASEETGGTVCDIHRDFAYSLLRISNEISDLARGFKLTGEPAAETIEVRIENLKIPRDRENGWVYKKSDRSIVFRGDYLPEPESRIEISYFPKTVTTAPIINQSDI